MARVRDPVQFPVVLTVAGSDSGGGAGIQADIKTIEACGGFATTAVTSVTAQHTRGVESTHVVPTSEVATQCESVRADFAVGAVKTGMLATAEIVDCVTTQLRTLDVPAVVDPVMVAASGDRLLDADAESAYDSLIAESSLVTPNADEAEVLTGVAVTDTESAIEAGHQLVEMGADAAVVKGGHLSGEPVVDILVSGDDVHRFHHPRVETAATHGSGCTLSAAIATQLARGKEREAAVRAGIDLLERAVRYGIDVGQGPGAVHHGVERRNEAARESTAESVTGLVQQLVDIDLARLVPEVGMNVVGATPYAESPADCAAVDGRLTRQLDGVAQNGGVRFGASSHVARFLIAVREYEPAYRFAVNCRFDDAVQRTLERLEWAVGSYDRTEQPDHVESVDGSTMQWGAQQAFEETETAPIAVSDSGAVGKEPMVKLVAADPGTLFERVRTLRTRLQTEN